MYQAPRGTADILPADQPYWDYVREKIEIIAGRYGYGRIETPTFEDTTLFVRGVGQGTDIVDKEMYSFEDKGRSQITLRPEGTAPVCRAYIEHGMQNLPQPVKLYYTASIYRYDRPQAGRYREHHQFGYEAIGESDPAVDAEVIEIAWRFYELLGLKDLSIQLNSIGCPEDRPKYLEILRKYYEPYASNLCKDCQVRLVKNPLRLLDCKEETCQRYAEAAPKSMDHLCDDCTGHFAKLRNYLDETAIPYNLNHRLVRGLDYYTRTVFEVQPNVEGAQSTVGGGGRYDGLIEQLGGKPTPAIGFATGIERIILNLKRQGVDVSPAPAPRVLVAFMGSAAKTAAMKLLSSLRKSGISGVSPFGEKSLKAQMRLANSLGCEYAVILGDNEIATGTAVIRNMKEASQVTVNIEEVAEQFR